MITFRLSVGRGRLIIEILNDSRDSVEVALSREGSWQVTQTADPDMSDDDDDDYALLPASEPALASGSCCVIAVCKEVLFFRIVLLRVHCLQSALLSS